jgi:hypothetical protein
MGRKRLARLLRKLRAMPKSSRGGIHCGAAKKDAGRAFGFIELQVPHEGGEALRETFRFQVNQDQLQRPHGAIATICCPPTWWQKIRRCSGRAMYN